MVERGRPVRWARSLLPSSFSPARKQRSTARPRASAVMKSGSLRCASVSGGTSGSLGSAGEAASVFDFFIESILGNTISPHGLRGARGLGAGRLVRRLAAVGARRLAGGARVELRGGRGDGDGAFRPHRAGGGGHG